MRFLKLIFLIFALIFSNLTIAQFLVKFKADKVSGCDSLTVHFSDLTGVSGITAWRWEFGDGDTSVFQNPAHIYENSGTYTVKLFITRNAVTLSNVATNYIHVYDFPVVDFTFSDTTFNTTFSFVFISATRLDSSGYKYNWDFGDNSTDTTSKIIHNYRAAGAYPVALIVTDNYGCANDTLKSVTVRDTLKIPNFFTPDGDGINDEFVIKSNGNSVYTFEVFDRWGNELWAITARSIRWDGRNTAGMLLTPGTYFYLLTSKDEAGSVQKKGFLELVR